MLDINRVLKQDRLLRALSGLNRKAFNELSVDFAATSKHSKRFPQQPRKRGEGGGRKARLLRVEEKLFFILFYFKCYPTFDVAGDLFELDRSQTNRWMQRLQPVLEAALSKKMALAERKLESLEQFLQRFPEVGEVMIDGTEPPIQRPQDPEEQRLNYSGKRSAILANTWQSLSKISV